MSAELNKQDGPVRPKYTDEFRRSVVDHWVTTGKTVAQVAEEFGLKHWTVREWKQRYGAVAKPVDAPMPPTPEAMKQEIQQLRKELTRVTLPRDI